MATARPIDVICQHTADGKIIPLRIRFSDENGERQTFNIEGYRDLSFQGAREMPDGMFVANDTLVFECKIIVHNQERRIYLYYKPSGIVWTMTDGNKKEQ